MNQFPLCAAEKSLSFVIGEPDNLMPHKGSCHPLCLERQGTAWRGEKKKEGKILAYYPAGGCLHLQGNNVKTEDRHDCHFKQISMERCSALSGRFVFQEKL